MLKWTASAQKLNCLPLDETTIVMATPKLGGVRPTMRTPQSAAAILRQRRQRRATIAHNGGDKENILPVTSTPIVSQQQPALLRVRNSPLVLAPLMDILNVTPEHSPATQRGTPQNNRRRRSVISTVVTSTDATVNMLPNRRHSTVGLSSVFGASMPQSTLPCYDEEDYSPSTKMLPTGQELALRGLLKPVPFLTATRYFKTPETLKVPAPKTSGEKKSLPQKRKLEFEATKKPPPPPHVPQQAHNATALNSAKMGDQTLDILIDAILDSARKEEKKKKTRKSFNLRRRTLLKNQSSGGEVNHSLLSPSYAACDDPASDLSFLLCEPVLTPTRQSKTATPPNVKQTVCIAEVSTPAPCTPPAGSRQIPLAVLQQMPTPMQHIGLAGQTPDTPPTVKRTTTTALQRIFADKKQHDSFTLDTPVRSLAKRRRAHHLADTGSTTKKFKVGDAEACNYFEVGLALPSIYV